MKPVISFKVNHGMENSGILLNEELMKNTYDIVAVQDRGLSVY